MLRYFNHLDYPKDGVIYFAHMQASVFNNIIKLKNNPDKYLGNVNIKKKITKVFVETLLYCYWKPYNVKIYFLTEYILRFALFYKSFWKKIITSHITSESWKTSSLLLLSFLEAFKCHFSFQKLIIWCAQWTGNRCVLEIYSKFCVYLLQTKIKIPI